jgi:RimJ/RimL family protein N-acetyltransferase
VRAMTETPFIPPEFVAPPGLVTPRFVLEPLGPHHNERDYAAWTSSAEHIHATPGFTESEWPDEMTLDENRADLERHERDFAGRAGFTYTVLDPGDGDVIGCLYIYPLKDAGGGAHVTSWVRADRAELDVPLAEAVAAWLADAWPFERVLYLGRTSLSS